MHNNNSSRFGKLLQVKFIRASGIIAGGHIQTLLLEKSRVTSNGGHERNFHIFYNILKGLKATDNLQKFGLTGMTQNDFVISSGESVEGPLDLKFYNDLVEALSEQEFKDDERDDIFRIVSGILHLANARFLQTDQSDGSHTLSLNETSRGPKSSSEKHWTAGAEMWGVDQAGLLQAITTKKVSFRSGETIEKVVSVDQAEGTRDALCKHAYSHLFNMIIHRMNETLRSRGSKAAANETKRLSSSEASAADCSIFLLDIFGFEIMLHNSVEQLCINFCNERLHNFFLADVFVSEQEEYRRQGIQDIPKIEFKDNGNLLTLISGKSGIFQMLAEELRIPNGSDKGFLSKVLTKFMKSGSKSQPSELDGLVVKTPPKYPESEKCFSIQHFAGVVPYNVTNWLQKNQDQVREYW
jgi:myosin heavy subunit